MAGLGPKPDRFGEGSGAPAVPPGQLPSGAKPDASAPQPLTARISSHTITELQDRVSTLETQNMILLYGCDAIEPTAVFSQCLLLRGGRSLATLAAAGLLMRRTVSARTVAAERFVLYRQGTTGRKRVVAAELGLREGRPELRMQDGSIVLMDHSRQARVQIDAQFTPAPPVTASAEPNPDERNWDADRHALGLLLDEYKGKPIVLLTDDQNRPAIVLGSLQSSKWTKAGPISLWPEEVTAIKPDGQDGKNGKSGGK